MAYVHNLSNLRLKPNSNKYFLVWGQNVESEQSFGQSVEPLSAFYCSKMRRCGARSNDHRWLVMSEPKSESPGGLLNK